MRRYLLVALVALAACRYPNADQKWGLYADADHDGYTADVDCNDNNPNIHPGATETCDGQDDNCNGQVDDNAVDATTWYVDPDKDGYAADGADSVTACDQPSGYADQLGDCNDNNANIHPGATDVPGNGIDEDCNGHDTVTCYADADGDGHGDQNQSSLDADGECTAARHESSTHDDCDDTHATVYPGAPELCDGLADDCSQWADDQPYDVPADELDGDSDHYVPCTIDAGGWQGDSSILGGGDCNDGDPTIYPSAPELCDGKVNACGGTLSADELDNDHDGYVSCTFADGVTAATWGTVEVPPVIGNNDCNDDSAATYPRTSVSTSTDPLPAGDTYEAADGCYTDADNDGYGATTGFATGATAGTDCDDTSAAAHPGGIEIVGNSIDENCDQQLSCYTDADGDGYGTDAVTTIDVSAGSCAELSLHVAAVSGDCNDGSDVTYPRVHVAPNPGTPPATGQTYEAADGCYSDADNDGYGATTGFATGATAGTDCDDTQLTAHPGGTEVIGNGIDEDCNLQITCYLDGDGDGHGTEAASNNTTDLAASVASCDEPSMHAATAADDCDDDQPTVYPGAPEVCDGFASDCADWSGTAPPAPPADEAEGDGDHYVACTFATVITATGDAYTVTPANYGVANVVGDGDCNDSDANSYPRTHVALSSDPPAAGDTYEAADGCYTDADNDGYGAVATQKAANADTGTDCDDTDALVHPNAIELCDGLDDDCNPNTDENGRVSLEKPDGTWVDESAAWALAAVDVTDPGTHWVCDGTYPTAVSVSGDGITIEGRNGATNTIIDGETTRQDLVVTGTGTVTVRGLTLTNGSSSATGGAVNVTSTGTVTLDQCVIDSSTAVTNGGGVYVDSGTVNLTSTSLTGNDAELGGNLYVNAGTVTVDSASSLDNGTASFGGGFLVAGGSLTVRGELSGNNATATGAIGQGGGGYLQAGTLALAAAVFDGNTADSDGGALFQEDGTLTD